MRTQPAVNKRGSTTQSQGGMEQPSLGNLFPIQTQLDRVNTIRREFDNFRIVRRAEQRRTEAVETIRRRQHDISPLHADEQTTGLLTQNV